jgi:ABC-type Zn uptake system ZnuABC Zn-binding protein ZnuA
LYAHTKTIVQDKAQIHNLVEIGKSVHNRQLTPQKAIEVEDADGIIINGVELE